MKIAFDYTAHYYDEEFTDTPVGIYQRKQVWKYLKTVFQDNKEEKCLLELNCGTGADAVWLAEQNYIVCATDISAEMINMVKQRISLNHLTNQVIPQCINILDINSHIFEQGKFQVVFSNFGGLNCLQEEDLIKWCNNSLPKLLEPQGHFIAVVMPRFCLWESLYFWLKGRSQKVFRRNTAKAVEARLAEGVSVKTWYHTPQMFKKQLAKQFKLVHCQPIGITLPPSYLNYYFQHKPGFLKFLNSAEQVLQKLSFLSGWSDHYLIHFQLKNKK